MHKKHYNELARLIRNYLPKTPETMEFTEHLMDYLKQENPNFSREIFRNAVYQEAQGGK
jgi:RNase adaptor protein for sRNA GlmZ degradation